MNTLEIQKPNFSQELRYLKRFSVVAGVDEAGVAPLAGPVVAAAVVLDPDFVVKKSARWLDEIRDSKLLTAGKREELMEHIVQNATSFGIGSSSVEEIDSLNILQARLLAMKRSIGSLKYMPQFVLVDGNRHIPGLAADQRIIVRGDRTVLSIACASIIAKVTRDNYLKKLHEEFPEYGFDRHKGYPTRLHFEKLTEHGPCIHHRKTFSPVRNILERV